MEECFGVGATEIISMCFNHIRGLILNLVAGTTLCLILYEILWDWVLDDTSVYVENYLPLRMFPTVVGLTLVCFRSPIGSRHWQTRLLRIFALVMLLIGFTFQCIHISEFLDGFQLNHGFRSYTDIFEGDFVVSSFFDRAIHNPDINSLQVRYTDGQFNKRLTTNDKIIRHMTKGVSNSKLSKVIGYYHNHFQMSCLQAVLIFVVALITLWIIVVKDEEQEKFETDSPPTRTPSWLHLSIQFSAWTAWFFIGGLGICLQLFAVLNGYPISASNYIGRHVFLLIGLSIFLCIPQEIKRNTNVIKTLTDGHIGVVESIGRTHPVTYIGVFFLIIGFIVSFTVVSHDHALIKSAHVQVCRAQDTFCIQNRNVPINDESMNSNTHTFYQPVQDLNYLQGSTYNRFYQFYGQDGNVTTWVWELHEPRENRNSGIDASPQGESGSIFPDKPRYTPVLHEKFKQSTDQEATVQYYSEWLLDKASRYPLQYDRAFRATSPLYFTSSGVRYVYEHLCCGDFYVQTQAFILISMHWIDWMTPLLVTIILTQFTLLTLSQHTRWKLVQKPNFSLMLKKSLDACTQQSKPKKSTKGDLESPSSIHSLSSKTTPFQTKPVRFDDVFQTALMKYDKKIESIY